MSGIEDIIAAFENIDLLIAQQVYAAAMENYIIQGGGSRGSCIITDKNEIFSFLSDDGTLFSKIQEVRFIQQNCHFTWEDVRPIPQNEDWFENVWREVRTKQ